MRIPVAVEGSVVSTGRWDNWRGVWSGTFAILIGRCHWTPLSHWICLYIFKIQRMTTKPSVCLQKTVNNEESTALFLNLAFQHPDLLCLAVVGCLSLQVVYDGYVSL